MALRLRFFDQALSNSLSEYCGEGSLTKNNFIISTQRDVGDVHPEENNISIPVFLTSKPDNICDIVSMKNNFIKRKAVKKLGK